MKHSYKHHMKQLTLTKAREKAGHALINWLQESSRLEYAMEDNSFELGRVSGYNECLNEARQFLLMELLGSEDEFEELKTIADEEDEDYDDDD